MPARPSSPPSSGASRATSLSLPQLQLQGVPIAYRQDDGSDRPGPIISPLRRHAYYPPAERYTEEQPQHRGTSPCDSYTHGDAGPPAAAVAPSPEASHGSGREGVSSAMRQAPHPTLPAACQREEEEEQRHAADGADAPAADSRNGCTRDDDNADRQKSSLANAERNPGLACEPVVKPVFAPLQEMHARQQQQQPLYYASPSAYGLPYLQQQNFQLGQPYGGSPQPPLQLYSVVVPHTAGSAMSMNYSSPLYPPQQPYMTPYPQPFSDGFAAVTTEESRRLSESPYWNTGLCGLTLDPLSTIDAFICSYCMSSAHFNMLYREERGLFGPMIAGLICVDCCVAAETLPYFFSWSALALHTFVLRREIRKRYGICGNPFIVRHHGADGDGAYPARDVTVDGNNAATAEGATQSTEPAAAAVTAADVPQTQEQPARDAADDAAVTTATPATTATTAPAATTVEGTEAAPQPVPTETVVSTQPRFPILSEVREFNWLECSADLLMSVFCTGCAAAQHHREMSLRGEWPGKVIFSRECFCRAHEQQQLPVAVPMTNMN
ncbi:hypothetical protein ABL78_6478 [Leptomonas seymouri]|uniref:PLAC8 family protein n=1 Tax=Leptomonas seymouri TaxID=5684 RepID=A0A0N1I3A7_LEPSE|nr:hypothetical protein ABL78_6478 [Leptomonas seymouri]|eukprot:KPI84472.1 hypothetical protein ABL78_6478 [Leptomonas seymouri]